MGSRERLVAVRVVAAVLVVLGLAALAIGCSAEGGADAECREADDRWARVVMPAYEAVTDASDRQRGVIATGTVEQRRDAQAAVWNAMVAFGSAARGPVPCSREAANLRLLSIEIGDLAGQMLQLQEALAASGEPSDALSDAYFGTADELSEKIGAFNRQVVDVVAP